MCVDPFFFIAKAKRKMIYPNRSAMWAVYYGISRSFIMKGLSSTITVLSVQSMLNCEGFIEEDFFGNGFL